MLDSLTVGDMVEAVCYFILLLISDFFITVKPSISRHPWTGKCPFRRGVCLWEVKNVVFVCDWDHVLVSLEGDVHLREVSVS